MPTPLVKSLAKKHRTSVVKAESAWEKSKKDAEDSTGKDKQWGLVVHIMKNRMKSKSKTASALLDWLLDELNQ